jgi:hypothetical protein
VCGENIQKTGVESGIDKGSDLLHDQGVCGIDFPAFTDSEDLAFLADDKDVCLQDIAHHPANIVEDNFPGVIVMNQLLDFSCVVQQHDIICCMQSIQYYYLLLIRAVLWGDVYLFPLSFRSVSDLSPDVYVSRLLRLFCSFCLYCLFSGAQSARYCAYPFKGFLLLF